MCKNTGTYSYGTKNTERFGICVIIDVFWKLCYTVFFVDSWIQFKNQFVKSLSYKDIFVFLSYILYPYPVCMSVPYKSTCSSCIYKDIRPKVKRWISQAMQLNISKQKHNTFGSVSSWTEQNEKISLLLSMLWSCTMMKIMRKW